MRLIFQIPSHALYFLISWSFLLLFFQLIFGSRIHRESVNFVKRLWSRKKVDCLHVLTISKKISTLRRCRTPKVQLGAIITFPPPESEVVTHGDGSSGGILESELLSYQSYVSFKELEQFHFKYLFSTFAIWKHD